MSKIVKIAVALLLLGLLWIALFQDRSPREAWALIGDRMDSRPARNILIVGNSRTSANDMPGMLRHIADSAHDPRKYALTVVAPDGASFESLSKDASVRQEMAKSWDEVIVQGESRGQSTPELAGSFMANGRALLKAAHPKDGKPRLIVNWAYDTSLYDKDDADGRADHYGMIQAAHLNLANQTNADRINVGRVWEDLRQKMPELALTVDGNHPSQVGSYFVALCLYADLSGHDVRDADWVPDGIAPEIANKVRAIVSQDRSAL